MKTKYFIYLVILAFFIRALFTLSSRYLLDLGVSPFDLGLYGGVMNIFFAICLIGLLVKLFRYHNKSDLFNS